MHYLVFDDGDSFEMVQSYLPWAESNLEPPPTPPSPSAYEVLWEHSPIRTYAPDLLESP